MRRAFGFAAVVVGFTVQYACYANPFGGLGSNGGGGGSASSGESACAAGTYACYDVNTRAGCCPSGQEYSLVYSACYPAATCDRGGSTYQCVTCPGATTSTGGGGSDSGGTSGCSGGAAAVSCTSAGSTFGRCCPGQFYSVGAGACVSGCSGGLGCVPCGSSAGSSGAATCGSACPSGTTCTYAFDEGVQSPTNGGATCAVSCASGTITSASASYGTNCTATPESCPDAVSSCAGSTGCSVQLTTTACGGDPCSGTAKSGTVRITCGA